MMREILEFKTVKSMEETLANSDESSAYRYDAVQLLKKWKVEAGLNKDAATDRLIDELLERYSEYS